MREDGPVSVRNSRSPSARSDGPVDRGALVDMESTLRLFRPPLRIGPLTGSRLSGTYWAVDLLC